MAYTIPTLSAAGVAPTTTQMNLLRSDFEDAAKEPVGRAFSTADQTLTTATWTTVVLPSTSALRGFTFSSNAFHVGEAGMYLVVIRYAWASNSTGVRSIRFMKNNVAQTEQSNTPDTPSVWSFHGLAYTFVVNTGDTLACQAYQDSGGNLNLLTGSNMFVHMTSRI